MPNKKLKTTLRILTLFFLLVGVIYFGIKIIIGSGFRVQAQQSEDCNHIVSTNEQLQETNNLVRPGETVCLQEGIYSAVIDPVAAESNGDSFITYQSFNEERATIQSTVNLENKSFLRFRNLVFELTGESGSKKWIKTNSNTNHIEFVDNEFICNGDVQYVTFMFQGDSAVLKNNKFETYGESDAGDLLVIRLASNVLIENNDFSQVKVTHQIIGVDGSKNVIIRNNYFRNPWDRVFSMGVQDGRKTENVIVENNLIIDSEPDGPEGNNGWEEIPQEDWEKGSNGNKHNVVGSIVRNNLWLLYNQGKNNDDHNGVYALGYEHPYGELRFYHNTFYQIKRFNILAAVDGQYGEPDDIEGKIVFKNNVFADFDDYLFFIRGSNVPWQPFYLVNNLTTNSNKENSENIIYLRTGGRDLSLSEAESRYPENYQNNILATPEFRDDSILSEADRRPENFSLDDLEDFFESFQLTDSSPGKNQAKPLALVVSSASEVTQIEIDDARYFTDGFGLINGDEIIINSDEEIKAQVVNVDYDNNILELSRSVSVSAGDGIYLAAAGDSPDMGIYGFVLTSSDLSGDLNNDGVVDIFDLVIVGNCFGLEAVGECERADANNSGGTIDIFDLVMVGSHFGERG